MRNGVRNCVCALLGSLLLAGCTERKEEKINALWQLTEQAIALDDHITAIEAAHQILALDTSNYFIYDTLANWYLKLGNWESAKLASEAALEHHRLLETVKVAAEANRALANYEASIVLYKEYLDAKPEAIKVQYNLAMDYLNLEQLDNALEVFNSIIANPKSATTRFDQRNNDVIQTIAYQEASYNSIGYIMRQKNDLVNSYKAFEKALEVNPNYRLAKNNIKVVTDQITKQQVAQAQ